MSNQNTLDLNYVHQSFQRSIKEEDDVGIEAYIDGYNELVKFLNLIGSVFSFVSSDVKSKIKVMDKHKEAENSMYYDSFKKMMKFEKESNLHEKNGFVSGSRTMLRLHRGLDFIRLFLKRLHDADDSVNTCTVCQNAYNETLAAFHPWYIRKAATLAMHALPNRHDLLGKMHLSSVRVACAALLTLALGAAAPQPAFNLQCKGVYDASIFARLDRICDDCYNLFREPELYTLCRKDCFTSDYFKGCVEVLQETDQLDVFKKYIIKLHGADPGI